MAGLQIRDIHPESKPRERLLHSGPASLSDIELLAIILGSGGKNVSVLELASIILKKFDGFKGLINADIQELKNFKNVDLAKASAIKACCEIGLRINRNKDETKRLIQKPADIHEILLPYLYQKAQEHLYLISLDSRNRVISKDLVTVGTVNETLFHPREIFRLALQKNASSIALAHNHPSGDSTPSTEDIRVTHRTAKAGAQLGIALLDHVIITDHSFTSIKSMNLLNPDNC